MIIAILILIFPLLILTTAFFASRVRILTRVSAVLMWAQMAVTTCVSIYGFTRNATVHLRIYGFQLDKTAQLFLVLTTLVTASALTQAVAFFDREEAEQQANIGSLRNFYALASLFYLSMIAVITAEDLGYLWIAIEATTLLSAPLVYFHRSRTALEATWKYLIICSVGIAFALFGTALFYAASQRVPGLSSGSLSLHILLLNAKLMPTGLLRLGFVFILLGYGTKAGLFPLHSWLPDAHSEAPAPASAMLSGALLNCALIGLWRTAGIMDAAGEASFVRITLLPMGALTVLAAGLFMLKQYDLKRMLAYSSMENVGLIACAIALRSSSGFALQAINHSLVKVALFLLAGNMLQEYGTKSIREIRGMMQVRPSAGFLFLLGIVAVSGTPPFGSFLSEWEILYSAADQRQILVLAAILSALAIAFIGLMVQTAGIVFGEPSKRREGHDAHKHATLPIIVPGLLLLAALLLGFMLTPQIMALAQGVKQ